MESNNDKTKNEESLQQGPQSSRLQSLLALRRPVAQQQHPVAAVEQLPMPHQPLQTAPGQAVLHRPAAPPTQSMQRMSLRGLGFQQLRQGRPAQQPQPAAALKSAQPLAVSGALCPPARNGQGTLGRKIPISANHFAVIIKRPTLYHYDVSVIPEPPKALTK